MCSDRIVRICVGLMTTVCALSGVGRGQVTVEVFPSSVNVLTGDLFSAEVRIGGVSNLQASHIVCSFQSSVARYETVAPGSFFPAPPASFFQYNPPGGAGVNSVTVDQAQIAGGPLAGGGTLCTISFTALSAGTTDLNLTVSLRDPANNPISATVNGGTINVSNPVPAVTEIDPLTTSADDAGFTLTVTGSNYLPGSVVRFNGVDQPTTFVSGTQVTAEIPAGELSTAGDFPVTVFNPAPGGGESNAVLFTVVPGALHHFGISAITGPVNAGSPLSLTVTARDAHNNTVTSFVGSVQLTTTAGTLTPSTSGLFVDGTRTEEVTVSRAGFARSIRADDGAGHAGTSGSFDVVPFVALSPLPPTGRGSTAWGDYDNDGDLDLLLTGERGVAGGVVTELYRNDGGTLNAVGGGLPGVRFGMGVWGDYDNDGDLDIFLAGDYDGGDPDLARIFRNDNGTFVTAGDQLQPPGLYIGSAGWGDYDNDGDLDLLLTGDTEHGMRATVFHNDHGSFSDTDYQEVDPVGLHDGVKNSSAAWGDYDNDGDLDIVLCGLIWNTRVTRVYRNNAGSFTDAAAGLPGVSNGAVAWGDYDADNDLDILLSGTTDGTSLIARVYRNDAGTFLDANAGLAGAKNSAVGWGDLEGDGDLDIIVSGSGVAGAKLYENTGSGFAELPLGFPALDFSALSWGDYDNDGDLDIALTGYDTGSASLASYIGRNQASAVNTPPTAPSTLTSLVTGSDVQLHWGDASDAQTAAIGLTYNVRVGTTPGGSQIVSPMADESTGDRAIVQGGLDGAGAAMIRTVKNLAPGTYYWSVQAIDNSFAGGPFAAEQSFTVLGPVHHFAVSPIGTPQTAGTPFDVTVTAQDVNNNTVAEFAGTVTFSTTAGSITPATSGAFVSGVRTEAVTVTEAGTGKTVSVDDGAGHVTTSNTFDVSAGPLHHFMFNAVSTPQETEVPFAITVTAQDVYNNTATAFVGTVDFTTNAGTIAPLVSGAFASGICAENVAVTDVRAGATITATRSGGTETGTSDVFDVVLGPFTKVGGGFTPTSGGAAAWGDHDSDGDMDVLIAADFQTGWSTQIYNNTGGVFTLSHELGGVHPDQRVAWGDYDRDGDLDFVKVGSGHNQGLFRNDGGTYVYAGLTLPENKEFSSVAWGDYDNDGDLDLALAGEILFSGAVLLLYRNDGSSFVETAAGLPAGGITQCTIAWGDYDNDGDPDLLVLGKRYGTSEWFNRIYRNLGGYFSETEYVNISEPASYGFGAWGDYDADGDLDLIVAGGNLQPAQLAVYRNDGGVYTNINAGMEALWSSHVAWWDCDNDGDLDAVISGQSTTAYQMVTKLYGNNAGVFAEVPTGLGRNVSPLALGDYDNDSDIDVLLLGTASSGYGTDLHRNNTLTTNAPPSAPSGLAAAVLGSDVTFTWDAATDDHTPSGGLTYNLRVGNTPGGGTVVSPMALSSGYRTIPARGGVNANRSSTLKNLSPGRYYWSVQAIDNSLAGSAFAAEGSFVVVGPLHHFAIAPVAGPLLAGVAYDIGPITAQDVNNETVTDFAGTVEVLSTGSLSAGGGTSAAFAGGILPSHSVTFSATGAGIVVNVTRTGGSESGASNTFDVVPASYTITSSAGPNGTISPTPSATVPYNGTQIFAMTPADGYHVGRLVVDGSDVNPAPTFTFNDVVAGHDIVAYFARDAYAITTAGLRQLDANGDGTDDMMLTFGTLPAGGGTVTINVYREAPTAAPAPPEGFIPCYLVITSPMPVHTFRVTVKLDMSLVEGFGAESYVMHHNETTASWLLIPGVYTAVDPSLNNHPSYQFTTDRFSNFAFVNLTVPPRDLALSGSAGSVSPITVTPHTGWGPATGYEGDPPVDWSWTGAQSLSFFLVPEEGSVFGSCDVTLEWDASVLSYTGVDFGSAGTPNGLFGTGQSYSPVASIDYIPGENRLTIHGQRGDGGDFTTAAGDYVGSVNFLLAKPGFSAVDIIGSTFARNMPAPATVYMIPDRAEVKGYLCDVGSAGDMSRGDGLINSADLSPWSLSYWSGVPDFAGGMANYRMKYDFGPSTGGYIFDLPTYDGMINFEDLVLFSISYGLTSEYRLMKAPAPGKDPVQIAFGRPRTSGTDVLVPVVLEGAVADIRAMSLTMKGRCESFRGYEKGLLLAGYGTPVPVMVRPEGSNLALDFAIMGLSAQSLSSGGELLVLRFGSMPQMRIAGVDARTSGNERVIPEIKAGPAELAPTAYTLLQNYPNPFNPATSIEFELPGASHVSLEVFTIVGERVATLVDEPREQGVHLVTWNGTGDHNIPVGTGVYFCRIRAGEFTRVIKMMLLR